MVRRLWSLAGLLWLVMCLGLGVAQTLPEPYVIRFSDVPAAQQAASNGQVAVTIPPSSEPERPSVPADTWLKHHDWKQVWPLMALSGHVLSFAGPATQRYLRVATDNSYYIWSHRLELDPQQLPFLELTWGIERFPRQAALDLYGHNDRPIVVMVSFGPKLPTPGLLPDVPRALAFFWGETETVGMSYTCVTPRNGHEAVRLQCNYPHVKYIALRHGDVGTVHTDRVSLLDLFWQYFPEYWQEHQRMPPIVGVSFEAGSTKTNSISSARLYTLVFTAAAPSDGASSLGEGPARKGP
jgi:hypothetical protein